MYALKQGPSAASIVFRSLAVSKSANSAFKVSIRLEDKRPPIPLLRCLPGITARARGRPSLQFRFRARLRRRGECESPLGGRATSPESVRPIRPAPARGHHIYLLARAAVLPRVCRAGIGLRGKHLRDRHIRE